MKKDFFVVLMGVMLIQLYCFSIEYTVVKGDCLWNIAKRYYNNPFLWQKIYLANKDKIKNPDLIYPGQVFVLPEIEYYKEIPTITPSTTEFQELQEEVEIQQEQQQQVQLSTISYSLVEKHVKKVEIEFPEKVDIKNFVSYGKIVDAKEKKFIYIDYDIVFCQFDKKVNIGDIFGIYHLGPSQYDVNLKDVPSNQLTLVGKLKVVKIGENVVTGEIIRIYSPVTIGDMLSRIEYNIEE